MFAKIIVAVFLLVCSSGRLNANDSLQPLIQQHQQVMQLLVNTYSAGDNRLISDEEVDVCFSYYSKQQQEVYNNYNEQYLTCIQTAKDARSALTELNAKQREDIVAQGTDICTALNYCQQDEDALTFFQCTYTTASNEINTLLNITAESNNVVNDIQVQYQRIDNDETVCTTTAKNEYALGLSNTATFLNKCLAGEVTPPPEEGSTPPVTVTDTPTPTEPTATETEPESSTTETEPVPTETEPVPTETEPLPTETTEQAPEEDLRYRPMTRMNMWNMLRRV